MSKIAVVYWSGTGNTALMAQSVCEGAKAKGADASLFEISSFTAADAASYDAIAFGCPSMGCEQLEDTEFEPVFEECKPVLKNKKVALFGSYGWGDGEWMRNWEDECKSFGITLVADSVICNDAPDADAVKECEALGAALI